MRMNIPRALGSLGGSLIMASGIVSATIGWRNDLLFYEPDPAGRFGHVGIVAGFGAVVLGAAIIALASRSSRSRKGEIISGVITMVLGHAGAITGALLVGTAGMLLCYAAGIGRIVRSGCAHQQAP
jgi:hypothetical protein